MSEVSIYHNPRCSKSRQTLVLLEEKGIQPKTRLYLDNPPSVDELRELVSLLGMTPRQLLRKGEDQYKELGLADTSLSDEEILDAMAKHPKLIERPIVVKDGRAVLGRPPENVLDLIDS